MITTLKYRPFVPGIRRKVRIITFSIAGILVLFGMMCSAYVQSHQYQMQLEHSYQRALDDLGDYMNSIDVSLNKGMYAGTASQFDTLATELWMDSSGAKSSLGQLPMGGMNLEKTNRFIAQVGDFSMALSRKVEEGQAITEEEHENMEALAGYAKKLSELITSIRQEINDGNMSMEQMQESLKNLQEPEGEPTINSGFLDFEEQFTDYPTLIYDGPFSDHIQQKEAKWLKGREEIDRGAARGRASQFTGESTMDLKDAGEESGAIPSYNFTTDTLTVNVTKQGGYCSWLLNSREIGMPTLDAQGAIEKAKQYLEDHGITSMEESYYSTSGGICTINFAYQQGSVTCYTDLIKVGVALDDGQVVMFDARGYLMNHQDRALESASLTKEQAQEKLSAYLTVQSAGVALIPTDAGSENLCYEFMCKGKNDQKVLVYVNCQTGEEEQILILLETEGGILTI